MNEVNPMKYALVKILRGNIVYESNEVLILTDYPPDDETDCITMNDRGGIPDQNVMVCDVLEPLDEGHPYFNPESPDDLYAQKIRKLRDVKGTLDLHIWANSTTSRDSIVRQIITVLQEALSFNYKYCTKYISSSQRCNSTNAACDALNVLNHLGIQGKCPYADVEDVDSPNYRNPSTFFYDNGISIQSVDLKGEQNADDLDKIPEVYHSVIPIDYEVESVIELKVNPVCAIDLSNSLLNEDKVIEPAKNKESISRLGKQKINP